MNRYRLPADDLAYAASAARREFGTASVRTLHERLGAPAGRIYTTTAKVVDRLREKGLVMRSRDRPSYRPISMRKSPTSTISSAR